MLTILRKPYAAGLAAANLLVRLAGGAVALALVLHAQAGRGSLTAAGIIAGAYAAGTACGAPVTGRLVDRLGATRVLLTAAAVHAAALLAVAGLPHAPLAAAEDLAALAGGARPPVAAWMRGIWAAILDTDEQRRASYRLESALLEIGFIAGPLVAGLLAALGRPALGLALAAVTTAAATTVFALLPPARHAAAPPPAGTARPRRDLLGALRSPTIRTLVASRTALGVTLGALQVAAAGFAAAQARPGYAGVLLGASALGSLAGSAAPRLPPAALTGVMCAGLLPLLLPAGPAWQAVLFAVAGLPVAPLNAQSYDITEQAAPPGTRTEARTWTSTATMAGSALGAAVAGTAVEHTTAHAAIAVAVAGAAAALLLDTTTGIARR
ncbi:MFS transporter [Dactylosporangium salmoneum]|uniref:MFS transporter n=1 Tax=Dactylosporangium salmoneum TaxID=53361 RepID=A0ABP5URG7_9ACTN